MRLLFGQRGRRSVLAILVLGIAVFVLFLVLAFLGAQEVWAAVQGKGGEIAEEEEAVQKQPRKQERLVLNFRERANSLAPFSLFGPEMEKVAKSEPQGLRITMQEGRNNPDAVGISLPFRIRGDFDVTLGFELLNVGAPLHRHGAGIGFRLGFDAPSSLAAIIARFKRPHGHDFAAHKVLTGPDGQEQYLENKHVPTNAPAGKLRLARKGTRVRYYAAEDGDFHLFHTIKFGTNDVVDFQVFFTTITNPIALDARLTELVIEADEFPEGKPSAQASFGKITGGEPVSRSTWTMAVMGLLTLVAMATVGWWVFTRKRNLDSTGGAGVSSE
jgi:hypothetical protein